MKVHARCRFAAALLIALTMLSNLASISAAPATEVKFDRATLDAWSAPQQFSF